MWHNNYSPLCPATEYESEPEASEFDLGTKIRAPKDIMLEELSLLKNKGSQMFKMRQQRVEKFIYENNPDLFSPESMVRKNTAPQTPHCIPNAFFLMTPYAWRKCSYLTVLNVTSGPRITSRGWCLALGAR